MTREPDGRGMNHAEVVFRMGPAGPRAGLAGGPDVWQVIRAIRSAREAEPALGDVELLALVEQNTGVPARLIRVAISYWAGHPDEINAEIMAADAAEDRSSGRR